MFKFAFTNTLIRQKTDRQIKNKYRKYNVCLQKLVLTTGKMKLTATYRLVSL